MQLSATFLGINGTRICPKCGVEYSSKRSFRRTLVYQIHFRALYVAMKAAPPIQEVLKQSQTPAVGTCGENHSDVYPVHISSHPQRWSHRYWSIGSIPMKSRGWWECWMYPRGLASSTAPGLYKESKRAIEIQKRSFYHHSPKIPKIKFICAGRSLDYTKFDIILADNYIIASLPIRFLPRASSNPNHTLPWYSQARTWLH